MGKRSDFARISKDYYRTFDRRAVPPLLPFVEGKTFYEPCAGAGDLVDQLVNMGLHCTGGSDIEPQDGRFMEKNALDLTEDDLRGADLIISNTPWDRRLLHPMIYVFSALRPTWLLFDAPWAFTKQSGPLMEFCRKIVPIGRLQWIPDTKMSGKDDVCWYLFDQNDTSNITEFHRRLI